MSPKNLEITSLNDIEACHSGLFIAPSNYTSENLASSD